MITVVEYDAAWPERFEMLRNEYAVAMAAAGVPVVAIEHVGSTSVSGLAAKPIIDCDIVVREADVAEASSVLMSLGFAPLGELGIPQRWAFKEPVRLSGTNTYELPRVFRTREFAVILRGCRHFPVLVHGLLRGPVSECGVKTFPIVAQLDVARDVIPRFPACRIHGTVHALDFQRAVE